MNAPLTRDRRHVSLLLAALLCAIAHNTAHKTREGWTRKPFVATTPGSAVPRVRQPGPTRVPEASGLGTYCHPSFPRRRPPVLAAFCTTNVRAYLRRIARTGWPFVTPGLYHFDAVST